MKPLSGGLKILLVYASPRDESLGRVVGANLAKALQRPFVEVEELDVRELSPVWVDGRAPGDYPGKWGMWAKQIETANGVVFVAPVHCYSVGSPARVLFEVLGEQLHRKALGLVTAAGSARSFLAENDFRAGMSADEEVHVLPEKLVVDASMMSEGNPTAELNTRIRDYSSRFIDFVSAVQPLSGAGRASVEAPSLFCEWFVTDLTSHRRLFEEGLGFTCVRDLGTWLDLRKQGARILLNSESIEEPKHPFRNWQERKRGIGVELALASDNIHSDYLSCSKLAAVEVTEVKRQEWGMEDFRILTAEGYYLRVTTPAPL